MRVVDVREAQAYLGDLLARAELGET